MVFINVLADASSGPYQAVLKSHYLAPNYADEAPLFGRTWNHWSQSWENVLWPSQAGWKCVEWSDPDLMLILKT